jgi:hypothetical protein
MTHHKVKRVASYADKQKAEEHARRLRARGENVRVRRDPFTGRFIVELLFLGLALGIVGSLFRTP